MNTEIQKKIQERRQKQTSTMKGQGSTEYIFMLAVALIIIVVAIAFALGIGGKATKGGGVKAELLGAEVTGNTLSIATNLPLNIASGANVTVSGTASGDFTTSRTPSAYNVSGGYEYRFNKIESIDKIHTIVAGNVITSLTVNGISGTKIILIPASGTSVTATTGVAPFTIVNIESS